MHWSWLNRCGKFGAFRLAALALDIGGGRAGPSVGLGIPFDRFIDAIENRIVVPDPNRLSGTRTCRACG
jgi:hypothetical protein